MTSSDERAPTGFEVDGETAWRNVIASKGGHWSVHESDAAYPLTANARLAAGLALARVVRKFELRASDVFFCVGSCFARNIEEHLMYRGIRVESRSIAFSDSSTRPNAFVNKFTPGSILNELRWSLAGKTYPQDSMVEDDGAFRDLQLAPWASALPLDDALERRRAVQHYFARIRNADVVVVTLGLVETWYDTQASVRLNAAPSYWMSRRFPRRFRLVVTDYAANLATVHAIVELVTRHAAAGVRIVLTVSPVPMTQTFTADDVLVANTYSKSTLRAVAADAARGYEHVQYYPAYDTITVSNRSLAYNRTDNLHVTDATVSAVTSHFLETYGVDAVRAHPEFNELEYLFANPDVRAAVLAQRFASGYEHWLVHGRNEGRPLRADGDRGGLDVLIG
ncbi:MAG TPA: GSCFA domain-containing protein [Candidatus Elarobacter sp.]